MKKLHLFLILAIAALGFGFEARAAGHATIRWEVPGSVQIKVGSSGNFLDLTGLTEVEVSTDAFDNAYIYAAQDYILESCSWVSADGSKSGNLSFGYGTPRNFSASMTGGSDGRVYTVKTGKLNKSASFTLDILSGAKLISEIQLTGTGEIITPVKGSNTIAFDPAFDNELVVYTNNAGGLYSVTANGTAIEGKNRFGTISYTTPIANGDKIEVRGTEGEDAPVEMCSVKINLSAEATGIIDKVWNNSTLSQVIPDADGIYKVEKGSMIRLLFKEDYEISSITANYHDISFGDNSTGIITVDSDMTIDITAAPKKYVDVEWNVYVVCPEGINLRAGNGLNGYDLDLTDGTPTTEPITFKSNADSQGTVAAAMTIAAGDAMHYKYMVSSKYETLMFTTVEGYWIMSSRTENLQDVAENPVTSHTFYVVARKIDRSAKAAVFLSTRGVATQLKGNASTMAPSINFNEQGYTIIEFDPLYDNPFSARFLNADAPNPVVVVDGSEQAPDENGLYPASIANGSVVKFYSSLGKTSASTILFKRGDNTSATIIYDRIKDLGSASSLKCYPGTEICIKPGKFTAVEVDGARITPNSDGECIFSSTGVKQVALVYDTNTGIVEIDAATAADSTVYNLQGVALSAPWHELPAGIYIVGGKKVLKK